MQPEERITPNIGTGTSVNALQSAINDDPLHYIITIKSILLYFGHKGQFFGVIIFCLLRQNR